MPEPSLKEIESRLGYSFRNPSIVMQALTHSSAATGPDEHNERLEFLGDGVVSLAVNDHLYRCYTQCEEGALTEIKSAVVSTSALARRARSLALQDCAELGRGMPAGESLSDSVLANLFEAVVGALYLDAGFERAREFVVGQLLGEIEAAAAEGEERNFKAAVQHLAVQRFGELPRYRVVSETGPDHEKLFEVEAIVGGRAFRPARGRTKKEAEQAAAGNALEALRAETEGAAEEGDAGAR
jgi:ribonuclease-3